MKLVVLLLIGISTFTHSLTLEQALKIAKPLSHEALMQQQRIAQAQLTGENIKQRHDYEFNLNNQLGLREEFGKKIDDNFVYLNIKKELFNSDHQADIDFNKSSVELEKLQLDYLKLEQKINIMRVFFEGVLADLEYDYITQVVALSSVRETDVIDNLSVGFASELDLVNAQARTQLDRAKRQDVEARQILARKRLADLLGLAQRPDNLEQPVLNKYLNYKIADEKIWLNALKQHNALLKALRLEMTSLQRKKQQQENTWEFNVGGFARLGEQSYQTDKNGNYRVGLTLNVPFGDNKREQAIKALEILIQQKQIELAQQNERLNQSVLDLFFKLPFALQKRRALIIEQDYLSFNLDKASLEYEMRLSKDLGNSMVLVTKNDFELAGATFELVLLLEQMNLLAQGKIL